MSMLAEQADGVTGVDTHRDTLAAAAVSALGAVLAHAEADTDAHGHLQLLKFARKHISGRRCRALEGTGSHGAGLTAFLQARGEKVVEACRPKRPVQRGGRKTDALDAARAAGEALTSEHLIQPRREEREALKVLLTTRQGAVSATTTAIDHLKALVVSAPDDLRSEIRSMGSKAQISHCAKLRDRPCRTLEHRMTVRVASEVRCKRERA